jgi:hypothetical protein
MRVAAGPRRIEEEREIRGPHHYPNPTSGVPAQQMQITVNVPDDLMSLAIWFMRAYT